MSYMWKDYAWNYSAWSFEIRIYLTSIWDNSAIMFDEDIESYNEDAEAKA